MQQSLLPSLQPHLCSFPILSWMFFASESYQVEGTKWKREENGEFRVSIHQWETTAQVPQLPHKAALNSRAGCAYWIWPLARRGTTSSKGKASGRDKNRPELSWEHLTLACQERCLGISESLAEGGSLISCRHPENRSCFTIISLIVCKPIPNFH